MVKKIILTITALVAILFSVNIVNAASGRVDIRTSATTVKPGDTFTATISVNCPDGINGINTTYNYDSSKLELVEKKVANSENFSDMSGGRNGVVEIIANKPNLTSENMYMLTFKVKDNAQEGTTATINTGDIKVNSLDKSSNFIEPAKTANINITTATQSPSEGNQGNNSNNNSTNNGADSNLNSGNNSGGISGITGNTVNGNNTVTSGNNNKVDQASNSTNSIVNKILPKTGEARNKILLIIFIAIAAGFSLIFYIKTNEIKRMYR